MPDIYISRAGMESKALDEKVTQTEIGTVKAHVVQLEEAALIKAERLRVMAADMAEMRQNLETLKKVLQLDPTVSELRTEISRRTNQWKSEATQRRPDLC